MKKKKFIITLLCIVTLFITLNINTDAAVISEAELRNQVESRSSTEVSGNIFIWFLCAVAFVKISHKIDSFMSSLGINVGNTVGTIPALSAVPHESDGESFADTQAALSATPQHSGDESYTGAIPATSSIPQFSDGAGSVDVLPVENIRNNAGMSDLSQDSFVEQMGYAGQPDIPTFSNLQADGGMISGIETSAANPDGTEFRMYNASQYAAPEGSHTTVEATDNSKWYKNSILLIITAAYPIKRRVAI